MSIFHFRKKNTKRSLSISEKAVADKVVGALSLSRRDSVLEITNGCSMTDCGVFSKCGCFCKILNTLSGLDGGEYDCIYLFNLPLQTAATELKYINDHLSPYGKTVVLNTENPLSIDDIKKLAVQCGKHYSEPIVSADFSLLIID